MTRPATDTPFFHNLLLFGRLLHAAGLGVSPGQMITVVQALPHIDIGQQHQLYHTLRALLLINHEDIPLFDHAFDQFWHPSATAPLHQALSDLLTPATPPQPEQLIVPPSLDEEEAETPSDEEEEEDDTTTLIELTQVYSQQEQLRERDFSTMDEAELALIQQFMAKIVWQLGQRRTRRFQPGQGEQLALRQLLRRNLRYGGEWLDWPRRERKIKPRPLVIIADVSGSMERYTRLLLHFVYGMAMGLSQHVEAFVFSTHLTRISRQLRRRSVTQALREVSEEVSDWSGGTRIGESLHTFNYQWGRRVLRRGAVVLLISDGWDRGDPALLGREMARLQRTCHRLIWLNPLLGLPRYEPLTRGIQAALPYIDDFLPVHNLASLEMLATHLAALDLKGASRQRHRPLIGAAFSRPR